MRFNRRTILLVSCLAAFIGSAIFAYAVLAQPDLGLEYGAATGLPSTDIRLIAARIIRAALGLLGIVALALILYGGYTWMTAGGNEENIAKAKKILINATIGLIIILSAFAIVSFVINALIQATTGGEGGDGGESGPPGGFSKVLYITSMPGNDLGCGARNVHPVIVFNRPVDLTTVPSNLIIEKKSDGSPANGTWNYVAPDRQNAIVFDPIGDCGVEPPRNDCLDASTTYQIRFANATAIKSQAPDILDLNCNVGNYKNQCTNNPSVEFTTGDSVDVLAPTINILIPPEGQDFSQGSVVDVYIDYADDFGLQNLSLQANGFDVDWEDNFGCKKSGTTTLHWASGSSPTGTYALTAIGMDGSANTASDTRNIVLRPATCYNTVLDPGEEQIGPPACCAFSMGCGCGACSGGSCTTGTDCASGYCEDGVCLDKMMIKQITPSSGAASTTYLSIFGQYFGEDGGHVYMTKSGGGWTEAFVVSCGAGIDNWTQSQLIVKVPPDAATGPLYIETASTTVGVTERKWTDYSNDSWGTKTPAPIGEFTITNELLPGLCAIRPNTGTPYMDVLLLGESFGATQGTGDGVVFNSSTAVIREWFDTRVKARVPALGNGSTPVYITNNAKKSNVVRFYVYDLLDSGAPLIESISPTHGARGEYITITGKNFSNQKGLVWFKFGGGSPSISGSSDFPPACEGSVWTDKQIIVKFPADGGLSNGDYTVQVQRSTDSVIGPIGAEFTLESGNPSPGICKIDPSSGPVPFASSTVMSIHGEYFNPESVPYAYGDVIPFDSPLAVPYYWTVGSSATSTQGRLISNAIFLISEEQINAHPPTGTQTGLVVAYRGTDQKMGNGMPFTVYDCVANGNKCANEDYRCCTTGNDKGICRLNSELCDGETRSTGYMWRFNTGPFPPTPYVIERCDAGTDLGHNLPSPAPNIAWTAAGNFDSYNACRTALVNIEFSMAMKADTINASNIKVYKCTTSSVENTFFNTLNTCDHIGDAIAMADDSYDLDFSAGDESGSRQYISMIPESRRWADNTWYHVVLTDNVQSAPTSYLFGTTTMSLGPQTLKKTRNCGADTSYCFIFKTDARDCKLKDVIVTPYSYWTAVLEEPIKYRAVKDNSEDPGTDMFWKGSGLSDQHCILMDMINYDWEWSSQNDDYADIYSTTGTNNNRAQVSALANTVAVGLTSPLDAVNINAKATRADTGEIASDSGLVAWWDFDGSTEAVVPDKSGSGHDATIQGPYTFVTGVIGNALSLSGTDNYALISNPNSFPSGYSPRSMCAWGRPTDVELEGWRWIAAFGMGSYGNAMFIGRNGNVLVGGAWGSDILIEDSWESGEWKHVCLTFDSETAKLYGDGALLGSMIGGAWNLQLGRANIGAQVHWWPDQLWDGEIDDLRIYNKALTSEEVQNVYNGLSSEGGSVSAGESKTGESPLTIDLSKPRVLDYWPKCLSACPNAEVGAVFNILMSTHNVSENSVHLYKCNDENCLDTTPVDINPYFDSADRRKLRVNYSSSTLNKNSIYQVVLSYDSTSTAGQSYQLWAGANKDDASAYGKPMQQSFTWRFRTKQEECVIDTVSIIPALFTAVYVDDKQVYSAEPRSAPDDCDPKGQRLDPWKIDWDWLSTSSSVAEVTEFTTLGQSPACTASCLKKGSDVAAGAADIVPLCGNNIIEAGEDCDPPQAGIWYGPSTTVHCSLNCLRPGNIKKATTTFETDQGLCGDGHVGYGEECDPEEIGTKNGCSDVCTRIGSSPSTGAEEIGASICGNGAIGVGEDCDLGVAPLWTSRTSSMNCSVNCLHLGTALSSGWCAINTSTFGGFAQKEYINACKKSMSQCGDGIASPDEDADCDVGGGHYDVINCTPNCLAITLAKKECNPTSTIEYESPYEEGLMINKDVYTEGCGANGQHLGSSLYYSEPSVCGDEVVGIGEDPACETGFVYSHSFINPWTLATGVGEGTVSGEPPAQTTDIKGTGTQKVMVGSTEKTYAKSGSGQFKIMCGYATDLECKSKFGPNFGLAANTCCYERADLISTYPVKNDDSPPYDICPNTYIEAVFNKRIDPTTVVGNIVIARGSTATSCPFGQDNVTGLVKSLEGVLSYADSVSAPWYKRVWARIAGWFKTIFFGSAGAAPYEINSKVFCAGGDVGTPTVVSSGDLGSTDVNVTSTIMISLKAPLATTTDYAILIRPGVKDTRGVSVKDADWAFITGEEICELNSVTVEPPEYLFQHSGSSTQFVAKAAAANGQLIQSVDGYRWDLAWAPLQNDYVYLTDTTTTINTVTAKNSNGELDISATTNMTENIYSATNPLLSGLSHITVFLCENPWPPADSFPFEDAQYDFKTYYCRDNGGPGTADDLPDISASSTTWTTSDGNPYLKRYLFTNPDNKDAIGIQVFKNTSRLSIRDWFNAQGYSGSFGSLKVDGYDAISDGNNTYVEALKMPSSFGSLYSNVYLFSVNSDKKSETKNVYDQIMKNLKFNLDLLQLNVCGNYSIDMGEIFAKEVTSIKNDFACQNDLDCMVLTEEYNKDNPDSPLSTSTRYCLNFKDKVQRNYQRLKDLRAIVGNIRDYNESWQEANASTENHYPFMQESTYLPGHALTVWPSSWSAFSAELGSTLPNDPINKLVQGGTCYLNPSKACYQDISCATNSANVLNNRISYWPIEDTIKDDGSLKNDGTYEGTVGLVAGKGHGKALEFTGQSDAKFIIPHNDEYNSDNFTLSVWFYPTKKNTATILKKGGWDATNGKSLGGFELEYSGFSFYDGLSRFNNGTIRFALFPTSTDANSYYAVDTGAPLALNQWHHIAVSVKDYTSYKTIYLYVDGAVYNVIRNQSMAEMAGAQMAFNTFNLEGGLNLNGLVDNMAFYDYLSVPAVANDIQAALCIMHDAETGWSAEDRRFSFVCNTSSYGYRYIYNDASKDFVLRANLENDGLFNPLHAGANTFINGMVSSTEDVDFSYGICGSADEISSPYNLVCGDGILGGDEECDPPGKTEYDLSDCPSDGPFVAERKVCESDCTWPALTAKMSCRAAVGGSCGDGKLQQLAGEWCDDGVLNGQLGRCNMTCDGTVSGCGNASVDSLELCDTAQYKNEMHCTGGKCPGWCVGGNYLFSMLSPLIIDATFRGCDENSDCMTNNCYISDSRYGLTKVDSCNYDCKSRGPYCGDGIVAAEWGELCEEDESCTVDGKVGKKECTYCRHDNRAISGLQNLWSFDLVDESTGVVFDAKLNRDATCVFNSVSYCPILKAGNTPGGRAYEYGGSEGVKAIKVDDDSEDLLEKDFTIEAWINPYSSMTASGHRVIQKGITGEPDNGGFFLWYYGGSQKLAFVVWENGTDAGDEGPRRIWSETIASNTWHHIVVVFDGQTDMGGDTWQGTTRLYVDGELEDSTSSIRYSTTDYPLCMGARCKISGSEFIPDGSYAYFKGMIDEFYLYNIALSEQTIQQHYESNGWYCSATTGSAEEGECGNGVIDEEEVCDTEWLNGVECTPILPQTSCTYCSADCKNVVTYTSPSTASCGNGVVDDWEACDINDPDPRAVLYREFGALLDWDDVGPPPPWEDYCVQCKSDCSGYSYLINGPSSPCVADGLGYCGDGHRDVDFGPPWATAVMGEKCDGNDPGPCEWHCTGFSPS